MPSDSTRDLIYAQKTAQQTAEQAPPDGPFEFSEAVASVFPDMLRRSIPGYSATLEAIQSLTRTHARPGTRLYDLGCSLGASTLAMRHAIDVDGCEIIAVDNAPAMIERCEENLSDDNKSTPVDVRCMDVRNLEFSNASVVVMNYTLQFLPPDDRNNLVARIADGMIPGGLFLLSEKVVDPDPTVEATLQALHLDFKRRHDYSELEIARKRAALENVLVPDTENGHRDRLQEAGFQHVGVWQRYFNFLSIVAIR